MYDQCVYVVTSNDKDNIVDCLFFFEKKNAMQALIHSIVTTRKAFHINVYCQEKERDAPLKLRQQIKLKKSDDGCYHFWLLKAFLSYTMDDVVENHTLFNDTFEEISIQSMQKIVF